MIESKNSQKVKQFTRFCKRWKVLIITEDGNQGVLEYSLLYNSM